MRKGKVVVGMSGGVDSSVAAYLLQERGYDVIGVTMQIWQDEETQATSENSGCCGLSAVDDARRVANHLGISYYVMNFKNEFKKYVMDDFALEYYKGRTPNPCIRCNRYVKWESLLKRSLEIGADYIATGHYASIVQLKNGRYTLKKAPSPKDQTYALYNLTQEQLSRTLMPVGAYSKEEIRKIAESIRLPVAHKPDSQDICFVPDGDYKSFLESYTKMKLPVGNFVDIRGNIIGTHTGIANYTVGQRKGLNLSMGYPVYVIEIRPEANEVVIGTNEDIFSHKLIADHLSFMSIPEPDNELKVNAKVRYNHQGAPCTIRIIGEDRIECIFEQPQRAITPGQAVVFYDGEYVVGGGRIM